jgi:hypothetical protein
MTLSGNDLAGHSARLPRFLGVSDVALWNGLVASRSTGQRDFNEAVKVVEDMLRNGGRRAGLKDALLSDDEMEQIQRAHFARKTDPDAQKRAQKSLEGCLDALNAFKAISGVSQISAATPDDCAAFQRKALTFPKNWRQRRTGCTCTSSGRRPCSTHGGVRTSTARSPRTPAWASR